MRFVFTELLIQAICLLMTLAADAQLKRQPFEDSWQWAKAILCKQPFNVPAAVITANRS